MVDGYCPDTCQVDFQRDNAILANVTKICKITNSAPSLEFFQHTNVDTYCAWNVSTGHWQAGSNSTVSFMCEWIDAIQDKAPPFTKTLRLSLIYKKSIDFIASLHQGDVLSTLAAAFELGSTVAGQFG